MAYDAFGRPYARRGTGQGGYFEEGDEIPESLGQQYGGEPRDKPSIRRRTSSSARQRTPPVNDRMTAEPFTYDGVSPDIIAAITEKVKKEVVEHLKQTGGFDEPARPPPMQRMPSNRSNSTASPPLTSRRVYTPPSPPAGRPTNAGPANMDSKRSPPGSPLDKPSGVRFSDRNLPTRPAGGRTFSTMELSTIDQKWGRLFDNEGNPTPRLGQFLRGLANHLIDCFQPQRSIVVTPTKMAAYYSTHALEKEIHPLASIFRAQNNELISELYQDLGCEHHLVQEHASMAPTIPALSPIGFERWMTLNIMAYPEEESKRFDNVVLALPIDADGAVVDGKPERLPKQISRHLLPEREDPRSRKLLDGSIRDFLNNLGKPSNRRKASITSPPLSRQASTSQQRPRPDDTYPEKKSSPQPAKVQPLERERNPYAGAPSVAETASSEDTIRLERERQPYTAQPGSGKVYQGSFADGAYESHHPRTGSTASSGYMPPRRPRRTSSPPMKGFSHSTPDDINISSRHPFEPSSSSGFNAPQPFSPPSSFNNSTAEFPPPPPPINIRDPRGDPRGVRDDRAYRRPTADEIRLNPEFSSPRDAERWDRFQESQAERTPYERGLGMDPPMNPSMRGAAYEDWYRDRNRGPGYDPYSRY